MIIRNNTDERLVFRAKGKKVIMPAHESVEVPEEVAKAGLIATFGTRISVINTEVIKDVAADVISDAGVIDVAEEAVEETIEAIYTLLEKQSHAVEETVSEVKEDVTEEIVEETIAPEEDDKDQNDNIPEECKECYADSKTPSEEDCDKCKAEEEVKEAPKKSTSKGKNSKKNNK